MLHTGPHSQPKQEGKEMRCLSYYFTGPKFCRQEQFITCSSHQICFNKYLPVNSPQPTCGYF